MGPGTGHRDHALRVDTDRLKGVSTELASAARRAAGITCLEELRGVEGEGAARYFSVFDELILQNKEAFFFQARSPAASPGQRERTALICLYHPDKRLRLGAEPCG